MLEYKSKYFTKARSVFGEANYSLVQKLNNVINITNSFHILIPNCNDGIDIIPFLLFTKNIDCYEESKILINGGMIDNFVSLGLKNRLKYKSNNSVSIYNKNFYSVKNNKKYDLVFVVRTIQLKENNNYTIFQKLDKLQENVKKGGYLYLQYYIGKDTEVSDNQIIKYGMIKDYIDQEKWEIVYYRDNKERKTIHKSHPFNRKNHYHIIGSILLRKKIIYGKTIKPKRVLNRTYKAGSIYGNPNQQIYDYINFLKKKYQRNIDVLIVDAKDGKNVIPFAKEKNNVVCYETSNELLNGGQVNNIVCQGLRKRINDYLLTNFITIKEMNFYENKEIKKFDFVYIEDSLHLAKNIDISLKKKVRKLMATVREGGYLYIYYDMAIDESDYETYPANSYFRTNEISSYFDLEDWKIEYMCERSCNNINYNHYGKERRTGYIFATKIRNRRKYQYHYTVEINNKIKCY